MEPPAVITEHLAGMAADWRALTDCELAVRVGVGDAAATQGAVSSDAELVRPLDSSSVNLIFPLHSAILTRWSVTARSVLAAMGEGVAQAAGSPEAAAGQALGAALEGYSRASIVLFLRALYTLPSRQALAEVLCSAKREEGKPQGRCGRQGSAGAAYRIPPAVCACCKRSPSHHPLCTALHFHLLLFPAPPHRRDGGGDI